MELNINITAQNHERGNILVTALLILLVMNLLGIGLANLANKEWGMASYKTIDAQVLSITEDCPQDVIEWFKTQTGTPASVSNFAGNSSAQLTPAQSAVTSIAKKLSGYNYGCNVTYIITKNGPSNRPAGAEIGNSGGAYGSDGNLVPKDYYKIISTGTGPKNSSKVTNTIISVEY